MAEYWLRASRGGVVSEETGQEHGAAASSAVDPAAVSIALGGASRDKADAFLDEQTKILRMQMAGMEQEQRLQLSHLRLRRFGDYAKAAMEITIAIFVALAITGLVTLAWQAHTANGLVAEPLRVPPDFAARGLDGTTLAQQLLDKLNRDVARANQYDFRTSDNIAGSWLGGSTVQIPYAGVSIAELSRLLRQWLGNEIHVSGEVIRTPTGISLTVRAGNNSGSAFAGTEFGLDELLDKAALSLLKQTRPFSYVNLNFFSGTLDPDTIEVVRQLAETGRPIDRAYANLAWAAVLFTQGR